MNDPGQMTLFITLMAAAFLLIGAEIYVPGGILGSLGAVSLVAAVVLGFRLSPTMGWVSLAGILLLSILGVIFWFIFFPRSTAGKRLTLTTDGADFKIDLPQYAALQDQKGVTRSALRPSGTAEFEGRRHDVTAEHGLWIDINTPVRVTRVSGSRIEVAPIEAQQRQDPSAGGDAGGPSDSASVG